MQLMTQAKLLYLNIRPSQMQIRLPTVALKSTGDVTKVQKRLLLPASFT